MCLELEFCYVYYCIKLKITTWLSCRTLYVTETSGGLRLESRSRRSAILTEMFRGFSHYLRQYHDNAVKYVTTSSFHSFPTVTLRLYNLSSWLIVSCMCDGKCRYLKA